MKTGSLHSRYADIVLATDVEGIFRLSGSAKRIKDLQAIFNSPDRYGKGLDWTGYTVHDAANIFRRYLNQLPEPIIPLDFYERFRDPLREHQSQAVGDMEAQAHDIGDFDHDSAVTTFQRLITELPALNRQLLLYVLDLLAVFSSKSEFNRMTSANLAAIFQPGILSHPDHDMAPREYRLSQDVLIFLIENQDNFLIGMTGTAIDEKTSKELQTPPSTAAPSSPGNSTPVNKANIGRSASNASAGADSLRKYGGMPRRNVSGASRKSRGSEGAPSPVNASTGIPFASHNSSSSIHRSNTVPSNKSPALSTTRFGKPSEPSTPTTPSLGGPLRTPSGTISPQPLASPSNAPPMEVSSLKNAPIPESPEHAVQNNAPTATAPRQGPPPMLGDLPTGFSPPPAMKTPTKERKISGLFAKSPTLGPTDADGRQPNKLRKKQKIPGSANASAHSSQASLHHDSPMTPAFHTPLVSPDIASHARADPLASLRTVQPSTPSPAATQPQQTQPAQQSQPQERPETIQSMPPPNSTNEQQHSDQTTSTLRPPRSREPSLHSRSSVTDHSDFDALDAEPGMKPEKRRNRWRLSSSARKDGADSPLQPPPRIGQNPNARGSTSSIASSKPRKSFTGESHLTQGVATDTSSTGYPSVAPLSSTDSEPPKDASDQTEKKGGLFGKLKAKMEKSREERKEREAEKDRAKSPQRSEAGGSKQSLSAIAHENLPNRGRSMDKSRASTDVVRNQNGASAVPPVPSAIPPFPSAGVVPTTTIPPSAASTNPDASSKPPTAE